MKKVFKFFAGVISIIFIIGLAFAFSTITKVYEVDSDKIENQINIVQISDSHSFKNFEKVVYKTSQISPDIIVLTGDIFTNSNNFDETISFVSELVEIAPTYYVNGNNDNPSGDYLDFRKEIVNLGIVVLENDSIDINIKDQEIRLIGILDNPYATLFDENKRDANDIRNTINNHLSEDKYNIVLSHRPQYFDVYVETGADLVLSGHTHGGLFRVPFINKGFILPDQGFFEEYDYGLFNENGTTMIINSGCATKGGVPRLYNPKEVVKIEIK